jgi:hypothetical protein
VSIAIPPEGIVDDECFANACLISRGKAAKQQAVLYRRGAEFTEIGIFLDQELFTLRPPLLRGEISGICASGDNFQA